MKDGDMRIALCSLVSLQFSKAHLTLTVCINPEDSHKFFCHFVYMNQLDRSWNGVEPWCVFTFGDRTLWSESSGLCIASK